MKTEKPQCAGIRTSGYWKGWPCGASPKYIKDGKHYCKNHLPIMPDNEWIEARDSYIRSIL